MRGFLEKFVSWPEGDLERVEQLEQLRALENCSIMYIYGGHEHGKPKEVGSCVTTADGGHVDDKPGEVGLSAV
mgnify:CR=1 FL=1